MPGEEEGAIPANDAAVDPARCPLCGGDNGCARAAGRSDCWCARVRLPAALLARIPEAARGLACVCRRCATAATRPPPGGA